MGKLKVGKLSRRLGIGLTEKGQKVLERRPYPAGEHGQNRRRKVSEYGRQLLEKQKLRHLYGMAERPFRNLFKEASRSAGATADTLLSLLERRMDNVVYRAGFARTRRQARLMVSHGHFELNGRKTDIPSARVRKGDVISVRESKKEGAYFKNLVESNTLEFQTGLTWLELDAPKLSVKVLELPSSEDAERAVNMQSVVEFYSR